MARRSSASTLVSAAGTLVTATRPHEEIQELAFIDEDSMVAALAITPTHFFVTIWGDETVRAIPRTGARRTSSEAGTIYEIRK